MENPTDAPNNPGKSTGGEAPSEEDYIKLDQFLKLADIVGSGGAAKHMIRSGEIHVNGEEETRRGRKLRHGDVVTVNGEDYVIEST